MQGHCACLQDLLAAVDGGSWETLAKRRVQHFGYKFEYLVSLLPCPCFSGMAVYTVCMLHDVTHIAVCVLHLGLAALMM